MEEGGRAISDKQTSNRKVCGFTSCVLLRGHLGACILELASASEKSVVPDKDMALNTSAALERNLTPDTNTPKKSLVDLLIQDYASFSVGELINTEKLYTLTHFEYVDILLHWVKSNNPSDEDVDRLWATVQQEECTVQPAHDDVKSNYGGYLNHIRSEIIKGGGYKLPSLKLFTGKYHQANQIYYRPDEDLVLESLLNDKPVRSRKIKCKACSVKFRITSRFSDLTDATCYTATANQKHTPIHCYLLPERSSFFFSVATNNISAVRAVIAAIGNRLQFCFVYECNQ